MPDHRAFAGLIIEINAAAAVRELGLVKAIAKQLRFRNIAISIKDVGEEWLPLSKLHDFPFVELKLDRRLVAGCAHDRAKLTTCRHIIDFADGMGARTVAEGVENRADFIAVREIGVHLVQGGLFAAPDAGEEIRADGAGARDLAAVMGELSVPKIRFYSSGDEVRRGPTQMRCGLRAGWRDGSERLCQEERRGEQGQEEAEQSDHRR